MALVTMRKISAIIQNVTIVADETADVSNKEQLVICIRWVEDCFVIHDDFIGMHPVERTNADQVVAILKNTPIKTINGKFLYTHCFLDVSNLAVADAMKSVQCISDSLKTVHEIGKK